jgi:nucleoside diphosphate kinase
LLTSLERKRELYGADPYFREAAWDAANVLGNKLYSMLHSTALLVVKPEALAARRLQMILSYIEANDFQPVSYRLLQFSRHVVRELWRYQWNAATIEKMELADRTLCSFPTGILLGLREARSPRRVPAAVRLQSLKGAAVSEKREPGTIRAVLRAPNRMISFVHTSDEPADVLRELGVFLGRPERVRFFEDLGEQAPAGIDEEGRRELERVEDAVPPTDFDTTAAFTRMTEAASEPLRKELVRHRDRYVETGRIDWWRFLDLTRRSGAMEWDVLAVCTAALDHETSAHSPTLKFDKAAMGRWLDRTAFRQSRQTPQARQAPGPTRWPGGRN